MELKVINLNGKEVEKISVNDEIFATEYNEALIHQVIVAQLANKRQGTKSTLTRTEVRGGGAKPWRQKGTGRARHGSSRSPIWRSGGVIFAPKPRDFSKKVNKRMKIQALTSALSQKIRQDEFQILSDLNIKEAKTKVMAALCEKLNAGDKALFVFSGENINVIRATKNLVNADICEASLINVYDIVRANKVFITKDAVRKIEEAIG